MAPSALHPSDQSLKDYGLGRLDAMLAHAVGSHLEECEDCRRKVAEATSDSLVGRLRDARGGSSTAGLPGSSLEGMSGPGGPATPPPASSLPPGLADHPDYKVLRELGRGGMGVVYLAENTLMGRKEVLKVVSSHLLDRPGVLDRFRREIRNAALLHHPNVVTAYSATRMGESLVFAMQYVEGYDLAKLVEKNGPLSVPHAANFIHQAALGLQHAHERGMVHRDIKPSNLMLAREGSRPVVKILDFGLAKVSSEGGIAASLTHSGQMLGTPHYIAPEQTVDAQKADIRADIYSLGCTLYCLLAGHPPFDAASLYELLQAHHSMDARPLNFLRPEVPVELAALVAKMLAKDPARRFQAPEEVARALAPFFKKTTPAPADPARPPAPAVPPPPPASEPPNVSARRDPEPVPAPPRPPRAGRPPAGEGESPLAGLIRVEQEPLSAPREPEPRPLPPIPGGASDGRRPRPWPLIAAGAVGFVVLLGSIVILIRTNKGETRIEIPEGKRVSGEVDDVRFDHTPAPSPPDRPPPTTAGTKPAESAPTTSPTTLPAIPTGKPVYLLDADSGQRAWVRRAEKGERLYLSQRGLGVDASVARFVFDRASVPDRYRISLAGQALFLRSDCAAGRAVELSGPLRSDDLDRYTFEVVPAPGGAFYLKDRCEGRYLCGERAGVDLYAVLDQEPAATRPRLRFTIDDRASEGDVPAGPIAGDAVKAAPPARLESPAGGGWQSLFDGKTLAGWDAHSGPPANWRVEGGALVVTGPGDWRKSGFLMSSRRLSHFRLRFEYATDPGSNVNSGLAFWAEPSDITDGLPHPPQFEIFSRKPNGALDNGSLFYLDTLNNGRILPPQHPAKILPAGQWNVVELEVWAGALRYAVNDTEVLRADIGDLAKRPDAMAAFSRKRGRVGFQSHTGTIRFRNIQVQELDARPGEETRRVGAMHRAGSRSFNGKRYKAFPDLLTWHQAEERCRDFGGRLAVVRSAAENRFLTGLLREGGVANAWLGCTDEKAEGRWVWVTGEPLRYANWDRPQQQPNNKGGIEHYAVLMTRFDGTWSDQPDDGRQEKPGFICQWDD
ncbi:Serine/threonine-protein kinase PrkC [Aquisphaera giovannonii]|uniref:Serine/threonine-protein kinase PrkC n=1 Tax=Aquisphaera giovannonii TaxID=406548 RepID=A0A5B9W618_9BACT|nr:protein kinase [Aquisphaera giovannonii]QEH35420.1 Serine/threonine-protein kinase PrkC [Aquisphaera giovannonii]